jgi:two-component system LytT family response regulator
MIRTVIVDDESKARKNLSILLEQQPDVEIVAEAANGDEAIKVISEFLPDLVFLDIKMPQQSGFDVLDKLLRMRINDFEVVFLTAFDAYAIKAIKYATFDYLLKPIDEQELIETLIKFRAKDRSKLSQNTEILINQLDPYRKLRIKTKTGYIFLDVDEIMYIEGDGSYSNLIMSDLITHTISKTIKFIVEDLPETTFVRTHKAILINKRFLKSVNIKSKTCIVQSGKNSVELPISTRLMKNII